MRNFSSEGLVIKHKDINEADKIITIFTKQQGKISTIAKGVRKINSRRSGSLELLNRIKFFSAGNKGLAVLTEAITLENFKELKNDLSRLSLAYLVLELLDQFLPEEQENQKIYQETITYLKAISEATDFEKAKILAASFQIKILREVGYLPELYNCVNCGDRLIEQNSFFVLESGGLVDQNCVQRSLFGKNIKVDTIKVIRFINSESIDRIEQLRLNDIDTREICKLLNLYTSVQLDKHLGSEKFALEIEKLSIN